VRVELSTARSSLAASTGSDGGYTFARMRELAEPCSLVAERRGYAPRRLEGIPLRADTRIPAFVLERGRSLRVTVVDASNAPLEVGQVAASASGMPFVRSSEIAEGVELFEDLPPAEVTLTIRHGWRVYTQSNAPGAEEARFVLPVHGTLELVAPEAAPRLSIGELCARVTALDDPDVQAVLAFDEERGGRTGVVVLLPGAYRVDLLNRWRADGEQREALLPGVWQVEVRAGANAPVELGR
jgi:hypothetical protein